MIKIDGIRIGLSNLHELKKFQYVKMMNQLIHRY